MLYDQKNHISGQKYIPWSRSAHSHLAHSHSLSRMDPSFSQYICSVPDVFLFLFWSCKGRPKNEWRQKMHAILVFSFLYGNSSLLPPKLYIQSLFTTEKWVSSQYMLKEMRKSKYLKQFAKSKNFCFRKRPRRQNSNVISTQTSGPDPRRHTCLLLCQEVVRTIFFYPRHF